MSKNTPYESRTLKELQEIAKKKKIAYSKLSKDQLIKTLRCKTVKRGGANDSETANSQNLKLENVINIVHGVDGDQRLNVRNVANLKATSKQYSHLVEFPAKLDEYINNLIWFMEEYMIENTCKFVLHFTKDGNKKVELELTPDRKFIIMKYNVVSQIENTEISRNVFETEPIPISIIHLMIFIFVIVKKERYTFVSLENPHLIQSITDVNETMMKLVDELRSKNTKESRSLEKSIQNEYKNIKRINMAAKEFYYEELFTEWFGLDMYDKWDPNLLCASNDTLMNYFNNKGIGFNYFGIGLVNDYDHCYATNNNTAGGGTTKSKSRPKRGGANSNSQEAPNNDSPVKLQTIEFPSDIKDCVKNLVKFSKEYTIKNKNTKELKLQFVNNPMNANDRRKIYLEFINDFRFVVMRYQEVSPIGNPVPVFETIPLKSTSSMITVFLYVILQKEKYDFVPLPNEDDINTSMSCLIDTFKNTNMENMKAIEANLRNEYKNIKRVKSIGKKTYLYELFNEWFKNHSREWDNKLVYLSNDKIIKYFDDKGISFNYFGIGLTDTCDHYIDMYENDDLYDIYHDLED